jgi:ribonuclease-3 family protein
LILLDIYVKIESKDFRKEYFMHEKVLGASLPSAMALAYLGDARHSLYIRRMLVEKGISKSGELNEMALHYVTAKSQAEAMRKIEHLLLEDELEVYKRAANSGHLNRPRNASAADYRAATGFEAVIGMLTYIGDEERVDELLSSAYAENEK